MDYAKLMEYIKDEYQANSDPLLALRRTEAVAVLSLLDRDDKTYDETMAFSLDMQRAIES